MPCIFTFLSCLFAVVVTEKAFHLFPLPEGEGQGEGKLLKLRNP